MNFSDILIGSIAAEQSVASFKTETRQSANDSKAGTIAFGDILVRRMNSNVSSESLKSPSVNAAAIKSSVKDQDTSSVPLYRSYRQLRESLDKAQTKEPVYRSERTYEKGKMESKDSRNEPENKKITASPANLMQILAQLLGLEQGKLADLLTENGISPDMLDLDNVSELTAVLSKTLGLDTVREDTLGKLLEVLEKAVDDETLMLMAQDDVVNAAQSSITSNKPTQEEILNTASSDMTDGADKSGSALTGTTADQLLAEITMKLDEYAVRLKDEPEAIESEIKDLMAPLIDKSKAVRRNVLEPEQMINAEADPIKGISDTDKSEGLDLRQEEAAKDDEKEPQMKDMGGEQDQMLQPVEQNNENIQPVYTAISNETPRASAVEHIRTEKQVLPAKEIISQIVEKAGVMISQDKSEMVMELKPESLGRITLKVVTERGIVMAKFVAENRQVQQVLETNMQILKDAMEKQGINVQNLSVSVRQEGGQEGENRQQYTRAQRIENQRSISAAGAGESMISGFAEATAVHDPYMWESSTINLTA